VKGFVKTFPEGQKRAIKKRIRHAVSNNGSDQQLVVWWPENDRTSVTGFLYGRFLILETPAGMAGLFRFCPTILGEEELPRCGYS
jgi:hypothetical protein